MTSTTLTSPSIIDINDPRLNVPLPDYRIVIDGKISPRYSNLREDVQTTILTLIAAGRESTARRLADCGRLGHVYARCEKNNSAKGHHHTCRTWLCLYCGQPRNLTRSWMARRYGRLHREKDQHGIELIGPLGSQIDYVAGLLADWLHSREIDSVRRTVVEWNPSQERVYFVLHTASIPYREIIDYLHTRHPGFSIRIAPVSGGVGAIEWMFTSTAKVLTYCGATRAKLLVKFQGRRLIKTRGHFYMAGAAQAAEWGEYDPSFDDHGPDDLGWQTKIPCNCGECSGRMIYIHTKDRVVESIDAIEEKYPHVDWSSVYDPFHRALWARSNNTHKSGPDYSDYSTVSMVEASPPA